MVGAGRDGFQELDVGGDALVHVVVFLHNRSGVAAQLLGQWPVFDELADG